MATVEQSANLHDLRQPQYYVNRETSWLEFNRRVLHEALDDRTPLLERLKFLSIFSSNLDEYFMVRVAGIKEQISAEVGTRTPDGFMPSEHLQVISQTLRPMVTEQHEFFEQTLRPQMRSRGIYLLNYEDLNRPQQDYLKGYFEEQIFPVLTPLAVDPGHPFPHISNLSLNLAVVVRDTHTQEEHFARVKVPKVLPRFVVLPKTLINSDQGEVHHWLGVPLEQVIAHNLDLLFPGMVVQEHYLFRITRDADLAVEEDDAEDLMSAIEQELRKRRLGGSAVRMEIHEQTPAPIRSMLMQELGLADEDVYEINGLLCLGDLMTFLSLPLPDLKDPSWAPVVPSPLATALNRSNSDDSEADVADNMFSLLRRQDQLIHHPYHSFSGTVQCFITHAAHDPHVLAIKMTLYRTSGDSPIVNALISAAENGKQVVVLVELKARFDEENNINWARKLETSGVHVVYGLAGLKTHTKVTLVVRREGGQIRRYCHLGTGNYNPKTARLYTDLGLLTGRDDLGADLTDLFNYLTGYSRQKSYRKLLVAPLTLRQQMMALIRQEAEQARRGNSAQITAKMNSLVDPEIITALYEASQAGVQIDLIIRGMCCLRPGVKGVSDNIRVISIIGRFLEHSRIFYFRNGGDELLLLGSADWMRRNLDRRVEAVVPIEDARIRSELKQILEISLADNRQAWDMQSDGSYVQRSPEKGQRDRNSQRIFMERALKSAG
ncbi:MAG TPA: polyphosphate kinase 1 [Trichocoleus sp.]